MNKKYTYKNTTLDAKQWATKLGISRDAFYQRVEDFTEPDRIFAPGHFRKPRGKNQKHGGSYSRSYYSWRDMFSRCSEHSRKRHLYYDKGITICERWQKFENFLADMGERPVGLTLDRYPNKLGNYESGNCRWATPQQQSRNLTSNLSIEFEGKKLSGSELAELVGVKPGTLRVRLRRGTSVERATKNADLRKDRQR